YYSGHSSQPLPLLGQLIIEAIHHHHHHHHHRLTSFFRATARVRRFPRMSLLHTARSCVSSTQSFNLDKSSSDAEIAGTQFSNIHRYHISASHNLQYMQSDRSYAYTFNNKTDINLPH